MVLAQASDGHAVATGSGSHTVSNSDVLGTSLNGNCIITVEDGEAVNQDVRRTLGGKVRMRRYKSAPSDSRNVKAVGVEGETAGRLGIEDRVLDGVVVTVQSHVPGERRCDQQY